MTDNILKILRGAVRPYVTVVMVTATIGAAFYDLETAKFLGVFSATIVGFWFGTRSARTNNEE